MKTHNLVPKKKRLYNINPIKIVLLQKYIIAGSHIDSDTLQWHLCFTGGSGGEPISLDFLHFGWLRIGPYLHIKPILSTFRQIWNSDSVPFCSAMGEGWAVRHHLITVMTILLLLLLLIITVLIITTIIIPSWPCCFPSTRLLYSSSSFSVRSLKGLGGRVRVSSSSSMMKAWRKEKSNFTTVISGFTSCYFFFSHTVNSCDAVNMRLFTNRFLDWWRGDKDDGTSEKWICLKMKAKLKARLRMCGRGRSIPTQKKTTSVVLWSRNMKRIINIFFWQATVFLF